MMGLDFSKKTNKPSFLHQRHTAASNVSWPPQWLRDLRSQRGPAQTAQVTRPKW
jgi:hypothetical protein